MGSVIRCQKKSMTKPKPDDRFHYRFLTHLLTWCRSSRQWDQSEMQCARLPQKECGEKTQSDCLPGQARTGSSPGLVPSGVSSTWSCARSHRQRRKKPKDRPTATLPLALRGKAASRHRRTDALKRLSQTNRLRIYAQWMQESGWRKICKKFWSIGRNDNIADFQGSSIFNMRKK